MKSKILFVFLGVILGLSVNAGLALPNDQQGVSFLDYTLHTIVTSINALHQIKIGELDHLESHLESILVLDVVGISREYENESLSESDRKRILNILVLVSVMNEKIEIASWKEDSEFQEVLKKVQALAPEEIKKFRCKDWNQPMWVGPECA